MTDFRNAYHFVPRKPETDRKKPLERNPSQYGMGDNVKDGHAAYAPGTTSGRLVCTITLECPTVIGASRTAGTKTMPALVEPFLLDKRPAIPATSLKGMISSVAESASRAPYRVLRNMQLTVLKAIGETHNFAEPDGTAAPQDPKAIDVLWVPLSDDRYKQLAQNPLKAEAETFEWFANNDAAKAQKLAPIGPNGIPKLYTNQKHKRP